MRRLVALFVPSAAVAAILCMSSDGRAGASFTLGYGCFTSGTGGGGCSGSYASFRASTDASAFASFNEHAVGNSDTYYFTAYSSGSYYSCTATDPAIVALWPQAMEGKAAFNVGWDATGKCTSLYVYSSSGY
jgi:hypothetical protein